jgi:4-amino-4-deoxy-L-arabinose transferase-like glycosyltransferase
LIGSTPTPTLTARRPSRRWRTSSIALILAAWAILQIGGLFTPGLLDDVDSVYIQIAREMLQRHDFVTPYIDGIRFFDKPPLMYWMAAGSMHLFGIHDWAARLPLALGVLALLLAVYALGIRFYSTNTQPSPSAQDDRAGLYAALALATSLGPYLYTRFFIPDILIALWMTLSVHLFLTALDRINANRAESSVILSEVSRGFIARDAVEGPATLSVHGTHVQPFRQQAPSALLPCLGFAAVTALNLLTKGLIGIVFPLGFVLLYLACTHRLKLLAKLHLLPSTLVFLAIAAPWHILAALRNPAIAMPAGVGLPARAGWAWFYLYNEHIARFLGRRIPHDYGQTPVWLFWLYAFLWVMPWAAFLPAAIASITRTLRRSSPTATLPLQHPPNPTRQREAALALTLWALLVLVFFTLSSRQEYYSLPAIPALILVVAGLLAAADNLPSVANRAIAAAHRWLLVPFASLITLVCAYLAITAPTPHPGVTLNDVLSSNPALYTVSLGHVFDLTSQAMGFFRGPLLAVALGMFTLGPIAFLIRRKARAFAANLTTAAGMTLVLLAAHTGLVRFYPILGSKDLALAIDTQLHPNDLILIDGELTSGSTLLFYTPQRPEPVLLVNGRVNGPWFGSFWPDAPQIFPNDAQLHQLWAGPHRIFLLTYHPTERTADLTPFGPVHTFATSGGKTILTNRTDSKQ